MPKALKTTAKIIGFVSLGLVAAAMLYSFLSALLISMMDYAPFRGIFGSKFVGFKHLANLFEYKYFGRLFGNTFLTGLFSLLLGTVCVFFTTYGISGIKNKIVRAVITFIFAAPLVIPESAMVKMAELIFGVNALLDQDYFYLLNTIFSIIPYVSLFALAAMFAKGSPFKFALKLTLTFIAVKLVLLFTGDFATTFMFQKPTNLATSEVLCTYIYKKGMMSSGGYSYGAAIDVFRILISLVPAAAAFFILKPFSSKKEGAHLGYRVKAFYPSSLLSIFATVSLTVLILAFVVLCGEYNTLSDPGVASSLGNSFAIAFTVMLIGAALVFFTCYAASKMRTLGTLTLCVLCLLADNMISTFLVYHWFGLYDTYLGVICYALRCVPLIALIFMVATNLRGTSRGRLALLPISAGVMFIMGWKEFLAPLMLFQDSSHYPLSIIMRQILLQNITDGGTLSSSAPVVTCNLTYSIIIPLVVLFLCLAGAAIFLMMDDKKGDAPQQIPEYSYTQL